MGKLMEKTLGVTVPDGRFSAYVAHPKTGHGPVIVVLQETYGVNASIRLIAADMAKEGFIAICPDLYWRVAPDIELSDRIEAESRQAFEIYDQLDIAKAVGDVEATMESARPYSSTRKVGVMGFCLGGLLANLMASRHRVDAAVSYYGGRTERYAQELRGIEDPLLMHLAGNDPYLSPAAQDIIRKALSAHPSVEIDVYPHRHHAFARPGGRHYNEADASLAKRRTVQFFRKHLIC
jgi:carboxymethylenebutenolidase